MSNNFGFKGIKAISSKIRYKSDESNSLFPKKETKSYVYNNTSEDTLSCKLSKNPEVLRSQINRLKPVKKYEFKNIIKLILTIIGLLFLLYVKTSRRTGLNKDYYDKTPERGEYGVQYDKLKKIDLELKKIKTLQEKQPILYINKDYNLYKGPRIQVIPSSKGKDK